MLDDVELSDRMQALIQLKWDEPGFFDTPLATLSREISAPTGESEGPLDYVL